MSWVVSPSWSSAAPRRLVKNYDISKDWVPGVPDLGVSGVSITPANS